MKALGWKTIALLTALTVASRAGMSLATGFTVDDAFITYRYAEHLAEGKGFVFNEGEKVQGTSTPLLTMILASVGVVFGSPAIPAAAKTISALADGCSLLLLIRLLAPFGRGAQFLAGVLFALFPEIVFTSSLGMESSLVILCMFIAFLAFRSGHHTGAGVACALLLLLRVDTGLWVVLLLVLATIERRRVPTVELAMIGGLYGAWLLFSALYFGSVLPHAVMAKEVSWSHLYPGFDPVRVLTGYYPFHGLRDWSWPLRAAASLVLLAPAVGALIVLWRRRSGLVLFPLFFLAYNLCFSFARVMLAGWYFLPGYVSMAACIGSLWGVGMARRGESGGKFRMNLLMPAIVLPLLLIALYVGVRRWAQDPGEWFQSEQVRLGIWLQRHAGGDDDVLLEPIGYIGWRTGLRIHDAEGLVSPRVLDYRERYRNSNAWFLAYVKDALPVYIVLQDWELEKNALFLGSNDGIFRDQESRDWFSSTYQLIPLDESPVKGEWPHFVLYRLRSARSGER